MCLVAQLRLSATHWTVVHQAPLFMGIFRQEYWSDCHSFSRGSSWPRDGTCISCISCAAGRFFTCWAIREALYIIEDTYLKVTININTNFLKIYTLYFVEKARDCNILNSIYNYFSSVQSLSRVRLFATPWTATRQASLSITNSRSSLRLMSIESVMPSSHLILCLPLLLLPPIPPSIRVFSNESTLHMRWPKYWSFSFSIIPSKEIPGLISFRMHWLDLLAVQGTLKSLLQHHSSKASVLRHTAFFTVQLLHPYMTTGKTIALTRRTFVGKVMSLFFNMLSRLVITFLPSSKRLLTSWLQSPSAVILEPQKIKSATVSTVSPSISHEVMGPDAMIFVFWMLSFKPTFSLSI